MNRKEFKDAISNFIVPRIKAFALAIKEKHAGLIRANARYPQQCVITEFSKHFVAECFGSAKIFRKLKWHEKSDSHSNANEYFSQFAEVQKAVIAFKQGNRAWSNIGLTVAGSVDVQSQMKRLGLTHLTKLPGGFYSADNCPTMPYRFLDHDFSFFIVDGLFLNARESVFRGKWVNLAIVVSKDLPRDEFARDLGTFDKPHKLPSGQLLSWRESMFLRASDAESQTLIRAQFSSLYLTDAIRETAIGEFLRVHPEILKTAFNGIDVRHEITLTWQDGSNAPIRPDVLIQRQDGFWDICDLKTALLMETNLTTGKPSRTNFKSQITDGLAQLAHYKSYFDDAVNAKYAEQTFGIKISDPQLILIVGNRDNLYEDEITKASAIYAKHFHVVDYDTVASLVDNAIRR